MTQEQTGPIYKFKVIQTPAANGNVVDDLNLLNVLKFIKGVIAYETLPADCGYGHKVLELLTDKGIFAFYFDCEINDAVFKSYTQPLVDLCELKHGRVTVY
jgi:hypothetical protein